MSDLINKLLSMPLQQNGGGGSGGVRDEMAWKNVFEKTLRQMFVAQQALQTAPTVGAHVEGQHLTHRQHTYSSQAEGYQLQPGDRIYRANGESQVATSLAGGTLPAGTQTTDSESSTIIGMGYGTPIPTATSKSESVAVRSQPTMQKTFVDNQERLHIAKTAEGVNLSIRLNGTITEDTYSLVRQVLKQFRYLEIAVNGIKINGKQITTDQRRVEEIWR